MKQFLVESQIRVYEYAAFESAILTGKYGYMMSVNQWRNRLLKANGEPGRTKVSDSERIAMIKVLNQVRQNEFKDINHDSTL